MATVLITGANRGIGLELAKQYVEAGDDVIGCCRKPEDANALNALSVRVLALDVTDDASVKALKLELNETPIDILINNAGAIFGAQRFEDIDFDAWEETFRVNTIGPFRIVQALIDNVRAGQDKKLVTMSSAMGSVANIHHWVELFEGSRFAYSSSKSAVNMVTKLLAIRFRAEGIISVPLHPDWVRTDMGGDEANISPEESAHGLRAVIAGLTIENSGRFYNYAGQELPW